MHQVLAKVHDAHKSGMNFNMKAVNQFTLKWDLTQKYVVPISGFSTNQFDRFLYASLIL